MLNKIKEGNSISIKDLNLPKENSNYVETKGEDLFKNIKPNLQLQRSMNNGEIYSKDINKIIEQLNPNQKNYDDFIIADHLNNFNDNNSLNNNNNKIIVPFSLPGTNLLKESQKLMNKDNEINDINNKSLKKSKRGGFNNSYRNTSNSMRRVSPNTNRNTSRSKSKKKNEKKPMSILNTIASFTQEVINTDIDLQKSLGIHVEESNDNNINTNNNLRYSNLNDINSNNNIYNNNYNINKKNSNDELKSDKKNKEDIIGKYKLNDNKNNKNDMNESSIFNMYT